MRPVGGSGHSAIVRRQFFELLRSGLQGKSPDAALFSQPVSWEAIYGIASEQTVVSNVVDGINLLPLELMPTPEELDLFLCDIFVVEQRNHQLNRFIPKLLSLASGEEVWLVKGQGIGLYHNHPLQRQPGDIDLLMLPETYEKLSPVFLKKATKKEETDQYILQTGIMYGSIEVELHGSVRTLISPSLDRSLDRFLRYSFENLPPDVVRIGDADVMVPHPQFNAFYLFTHILHHFWTGGVGFRQIVDWALMLRKEAPRIDTDALRRLLEENGLMRQWVVFADLCEVKLGLSGLPLSTGNSSVWVERLSDDIIRSGNFGKKKPRSRSRSSMSRVKWLLYSFYRLVIRERLSKFPIFPLDSLRYAFGAFAHSLRRKDRWQ